MHTSPTVRTPARTLRRHHHRSVSRVVFLVAVLSAGLIAAATSVSAAQAPVGLGTADSFAVLAGSGITNTGATTITGDVGTFPTPTETGFADVTLNGTNHYGNAVTQKAKDDLVAAYNDAAGRTPVTNVPVELGGGPPLLAGVYTSPTFGLTGTLTLDAQGNPNAVFIFQAGSTLIAEANSKVLMINGVDPCRVVWQVGSSATFKTGTEFVGDVLAQTSITAQTRATFRGRLLARDGAVTLDTNTITNATCAEAEGAAATTTPGTDGSTVTPAGGTTGTSETDTAAPSTPSGAPGTPTGITGGPPADGTPSSPSSPPLATTGVSLTAIAALGLTLLAIGIGLATRPANRTLGRKNR